MPFRQGRSPVEKPLRPFTYFLGMDAQKARPGGALSLGYFSLGTQREVTRSFQDRKLFALTPCFYALGKHNQEQKSLGYNPTYEKRMAA